MNSKNEKKLMKPIASLLAITVLAALALVGCNPSNSTETSSPNSSMSHDNGMMHGTTNMMATNNMPQMNTNMSTVAHQ